MTKYITNSISRDPTTSTELTGKKALDKVDPREVKEFEKLLDEREQRHKNQNLVSKKKKCNDELGLCATVNARQWHGQHFNDMLVFNNQQQLKSSKTWYFVETAFDAEQALDIAVELDLEKNHQNVNLEVAYMEKVAGDKILNALNPNIAAQLSQSELYKQKYKELFDALVKKISMCMAHNNQEIKVELKRHSVGDLFFIVKHKNNFTNIELFIESQPLLLQLDADRKTLLNSLSERVGHERFNVDISAIVENTEKT